MPEKTPNPDTKLSAHELITLYPRLGFGLIMVFGMVGNCAGHHEGSTIIFMMTAVVWVCMRIIQEAIDAYRVIAASHATKKPSDKDHDPPTSRK